MQSFPDTFVFYGIKTRQFRQVGNAVPPMLVKAIANRVYSIIENR
ncbi:MAG: DNA cytosine methyltransferase [Bacteroidales bacterium]|nr:DNA cytosine methyltransferase [Bacteroidales bacterium]